jgi:peroxiredoxin
MTGAVQVGQPAPPLELPTLDRERIELARLCGRPVLVSFLRHAG